MFPLGNFISPSKRVYRTEAWCLTKNTHRGDQSREGGMSWCVASGVEPGGIMGMKSGAEIGLGFLVYTHLVSHSATLY